MLALPLSVLSCNTEENHLSLPRVWGELEADGGPGDAHDVQVLSSPSLVE